jgi:hypothetical protein
MIRSQGEITKKSEPGSMENKIRYSQWGGRDDQIRKRR